MTEYEITDRVDITDVTCPMAFVKAKAELRELDEGGILAVRMNRGELV